MRPYQGRMLMFFSPFQSTHPRGVRQTGKTYADKTKEFQSTHPRGVRLANAKTTQNSFGISIHAPARGATLGNNKHQHRGKHHFNPRTREGCDTSSLNAIAPIGLDFNPRTREGCDVEGRNILQAN